MNTEKLAIRAYAEADEAQVIQLWREVFPDNPSWNVPKADIDRKLSVQRELFLVGDLDGVIVATEWSAVAGAPPGRLFSLASSGGIGEVRVSGRG